MTDTPPHDAEDLDLDSMLVHVPTINDADHARVERAIRHHAPAEHLIPRIAEIRAAGLHLGHTIVDQCPDVYERRRALDALEQAVMLAVAGVVRPAPPG